MNQSLRKRYMVITFCIMLIAGALSSMVVGFFLNNTLGQTLVGDQYEIAELMTELGQNTAYTAEEIIDICVRSPYSVEYTEATADGEIIVSRGNFFSQTETLLTVKGQGVRIFVQYNGSFISHFFLSVLITASVAVAFGTVISSVSGNKVIRPLSDLCDGIEQIARGDFSVRVAVPKAKGLRRLSVSFNKMARDLSGIETLRSNFINDVSHEFKTPLTSIHGFAKLLQSPDITEAERIEYATIIADESKRLSHLSSDLLNLSKVENQTIVRDQAVFSLDEQLRQTVLMLEPSWSAKEQDMQVELDTVLYYGSEDLLRRVWTNLLANAIKFTPQGGSISVRLMDADDVVVVRIKDSGIGMDEEAMRHIFDKFYQADASHAGEGAGLGLALVQRIINLCEGEVTVKSEVGKGSNFSVKLPVHTPPGDVSPEIVPEIV